MNEINRIIKKQVVDKSGGAVKIIEVPKSTVNWGKIHNDIVAACRPNQDWRERMMRKFNK